MPTIKTTEEFSQYIPVNASLTFDAIRIHILTAEGRCLVPLLGSALYANLIADYDSLSSDPIHLALLDRSRRVVAPMSFKLYMPFGQFQMSDAGFRVVQDENFRTAFRWQVASLEEAAEMQGYMAMEELLGFLTENKANYPSWQYEAPSVTLPTAKSFDAQVSIDMSRLVYNKLLPNIRTAERQIQRVTSKAEYDSLKQALANDTASDEQLALLEMIQPAIAHRAFSKGIQGLPVRFDDGNVRVYAAQFPGGSDFGPKVQADSQKLSAMAIMHAQLADAAEAELGKFLFDNHADYPGYEASPLYAPEDTARLNEDGISSGGFFFN
jgi:hypothetical protein